MTAPRLTRREILLAAITALVCFGVAVPLTAASRATSAMNAPAPKCKPTGVGWSCVLPRFTTDNYRSYSVKIPGLDLSCLYSPEDDIVGSAEGFSCDRLSMDATKCYDGVLGSLSTFITIRRMEVDTPPRCVTTSAKPGYKITRGYVPDVYYRNP